MAEQILKNEAELGKIDIEKATIDLVYYEKNKKLNYNSAIQRELRCTVDSLQRLITVDTKLLSSTARTIVEAKLMEFLEELNPNYEI